MPSSRVRLEFARSYNEGECARIRSGLVPEQMDDKWFIYFEAPWLYLHRSWTGFCVFQVRFVDDPPGGQAVEVIANRDSEQYRGSLEEDLRCVRDELDFLAGRRREVVPLRQVRAVWTDTTIRVYQAFNDQIADGALAAGTFVSPFKRSRMTWIKPSFLRMMYRSGWGEKDIDQRRILGIDITREGFHWALRNASLSILGGGDKSKPVHVRWDPERDIDLCDPGHRAIQVGLSRQAVDLYVEQWIVGIEDVTDLARRVRATRDPGLLPPERPYPVPEDVRSIIGLYDE